MADDPNTNYKTGDNEYNIFRKILARLNLGIATSGGGGGGGGGAVTITDGTASGGAAVAQSDTPLINTTLALVVRTVTAQAVTIAENADTTEGAKGDAAATDSTSSWTVISLLKGLWVKLAAIATSAATSATNSANLDVALSTRLKPADTLAAVTTVATVSALTSGNVGGFTTVIKDTTVVSTSPAYTAGDAVGGKRTIANAVRVNGTGILQSVAILDRANQKASMTLFIFDADPTAATITDNAAFVFSTDDLKVIAQVSIGAGDYVTTDSKAYALISGLNIPIKAASGTSLFAALVTTGTPTYAATTNVQLEYGILQD